MHRSLVCAHLPSEPALAAVAGGFVDAVYHDLDKATGVHVWTYAEQLARDWVVQRGGGWAALREVFDGLARAGDQVLRELRTDDDGLADLVELALARATVTLETAVAGVLARQLRSIENELVRADAEELRLDPTGGFELGAAADGVTVPYLRPPPIVADVAGPEVTAVLEAARGAARAQSGPGREAMLRAIEWAHRLASAVNDPRLDDAVRELWSVPSLDEVGVRPLFDLLELARRRHLDALRRCGGAAATQVAALRRLAAAYQRLSAGIAAMAIRAATPASERLRAVVQETARLRREVSQNEARITDWEQALAGGPSPRAVRRRNTRETERS